MAVTLGKVLEEEAAALKQARQGSSKVMEEEAAALARQGSGKVLSVSRLLTRDSSAGAAPSFRVYYGVASAGAVPFLWESQPGTPKKDAASDATMPPLTPPPSYYAAAKEDARNRKGAGGSSVGKKVGILGFILPRFSMARRRTRPSGSPTSSFSSASSSSSSASSTFSSFRGTQSPKCSSMRGGGSSRIPAPPSSSSIPGRGYGSSRMQASSAFTDSEDSATSLACFGVRAESFRALKGCRVAVTVRSALGSSVGGGHTAAGQAQSVKAN